MSFFFSQILPASVSGPTEIFVSDFDDLPEVFRSEDESRVEFRDGVAESGDRPRRMATRILHRVTRFSWTLLERGKAVLAAARGGGRRSLREMRCRTAAGILALRHYACLFGGGNSRYFGDRITLPDNNARRQTSRAQDRSIAIATVPAAGFFVPFSVGSPGLLSLS